jgi:hypothetical protein
MGVALASLVAALALYSGRWAVGSGQQTTRVTLPAASCVLPVESPSQIKLGEEQVDPKKEKAEAVSRAKTYLGKSLKVEPSGIGLQSAEPATWPDAALGCPEKDRMYAQVLTKGYTVILEADGKKHELHVAGSRVVSCPGSTLK